MSSLPLNGVRVVEYAQYVAGPLCGVHLLAPFGRVGGAVPRPLPAPVLGADIEAVLGELP